MISEDQQRLLIADILGKAIESGQIKFDQPPVQQIIQQNNEVKAPTYEGGNFSIYDALTCIMFTLNLAEITDINWFLVFLPFALPYIVFYGSLWSVMLWAKIKNRKNKKENGEG